MLGYSRWQLFKGLTAAAAIVSIVSLALIYFIPAPPSKITMATAFKGSSFEYYGRQYREIFARSNVDLSSARPSGQRKTSNFCRIQNPAYRLPLLLGGISDGKHTPGVLSLGTVYINPFWIFYSSNEQFDGFRSSKANALP